MERPQPSQHYSLRWNNHQSHLLSAFDALLQVNPVVYLKSLGSVLYDLDSIKTKLILF